MSDARCDFESRRTRLMHRHQALARGHIATLRSDGLIVLAPRRIRFHFPVRGFVLLMAFFMAFKGFMLASLGAATYAERLNILQSGAFYEKAGAFVMGIDPVSRTIADLLLRLV